MRNGSAVGHCVHSLPADARTAPGSPFPAVWNSQDMTEMDAFLSGSATLSCSKILHL